MTKDEIVAFLKTAGKDATVGGDGKWVDFSHDGTTLVVFAYESGDLMHIVCDFDWPSGAIGTEQCQPVFQAIEDTFPVVKLMTVPNAQRPGFRISTEQFEPGGPAAGGVFFRTCDLIVAAAAETVKRLKLPVPPDDAAVSAADLAAWLAMIEASLQRASPHTDTAPGPATAAVFTHVKSALALAVTKEAATGSAFCFDVKPEHTLYLTSAHVVKGCVEVTLYHQRPEYLKTDALVVARDETSDLALLLTKGKTAEPLKPAILPPGEEAPIAVAGYPRVQMYAANQFGELIPAIHFGTVTGLLDSGNCLLHDAICRPGNSGGPVFDPETGIVYGIQRGGWEAEEESYAVGTRVINTFLAANMPKL